MDNQILPDGFEPTYWNAVFHPSKTRFNRLVLGRFEHVSALVYVPGFQCWVIYDCQWGGMRIAFVSSVGALVPYVRDCTLVKFDRVYQPMILLSRLGFYCVPAVKCLLGLSCVAVTPDGLYRYLLKHGGSVIGARGNTPAPAGRPELAAGTGNRAS